MAVAADLDSLVELRVGVPKARPDPDRRGEPAADRLSHVERRALERERGAKEQGREQGGRLIDRFDSDCGR